MIDILIVEDDSVLLDLEVSLLTMMLEKKATITTACNGMDALELCKTKQFDLVLTDIDMPKMTGDQLIDSVKKDYAHQVNKFYILTGFVPNIEILKGKANQIFQKPIDIHLILSHINNDFKDKLN